MLEDRPTRTDSLSERPPASRPYNLADYVDGVGVFYGRLAPAHFSEHAHPEITVAVNLEGTSCLATWETETGRRLTRLIREGHTAVIPGDQPHAGEWLRDAELLHFYLTPGFVSRAAGDLTDEDRAEIAEDHTAADPFIRQLGSALRVELGRGRPPGRLYVDSLANVLAVHLLRRYPATGRPPTEPRGGLSKRELRRAVEYVHDNLAGDPTLSEIAAAVGLSPYHFSRRFKESTGLSPHRYVIGRRVERAREMLLRSETPIPEVARRMGFADQAHLTRQMRAFLGLTPGQIRKHGKILQRDSNILQD